MLTNMHEIRSSCKETMAMFEWSAVPLGHPLRNHSYVFPAWNISITPHNVEEIRQDSKSEYQKEWADSDESLNHLIATASI